MIKRIVLIFMLVSITSSAFADYEPMTTPNPTIALDAKLLELV